MIDHYKLIDLLSDRLRIEIKTAGNDLLEILEHLHITLKQEGKAELPGLGFFYLDGNHVSFAPDPQLVIDINFRYHGMQPILLEGANNTGIVSENDERDVPETAVFVINEPVVPAHSTEATTPTEPNNTVAIEHVSLDDAELVSTDDLQPIEELVPILEAEPVLVEPESTIPPPSTRTLKTPPLSRQSAHTVPIDIKIDGNYVNKGDRWRRTVGFIAFTLILLAGAGFSWYSGWLAGTGLPGFHEVFPEYVTRNDPGSITIESPTIEETKEQEQALEQELVQEIEQDQVQEQERGQGLGLVGTWQEEVTSFFTIVSATMFTERVANEVLAEVLASDKRARLVRVRVQGEIAWELHIGQFESRETAREANITLDRKFQSDVVRQYGQQ
jgi:hypothetical protein